jgi:hypothetical protein
MGPSLLDQIQGAKVMRQVFEVQLALPALEL